jgi:hypothetical protein
MHSMILFAGLLAMAFAAALFLVKRATFERYARVTGTITGLIERPSHTDDRQDIKFTPRIAFRTALGIEVEFVPKGAFFARMKVGDQVPILHDPKNPHNAVINSFFHRHITELVVMLLGLAAAIPYLIQQLAK